MTVSILEFTFEEERSGKIPLLVLLVQKNWFFDTVVYRKKNPYRSLSELEITWTKQPGNGVHLKPLLQEPLRYAHPISGIFG